MFRVEVDGDGGDLLEELLSGGVDNRLGGSLELVGGLFDLSGKGFFELLA